MPEVTIVKGNDGKLVGLSPADKRAFNRVKKSWKEMEPGEMFQFKYDSPRIGKFHRFHMVLESTVFQAQERIDNFDMFRDWLKIGAGHVRWMAGPKGGVVPVPESISYAKLDEDSMREVHRNMIDFLRGTHAALYLWKHLGVDGAANMMEVVLSEFDRL